MADRSRRRPGPTVEQVRAFAELVETGSFVRAADALGFASDQPLVRLMHRYAAALGRGPLVLRGKNGTVNLTPAGREAIPAAHRFLEAVQSMSETVDAIRVTGYPAIVERIVAKEPGLVESPPGLILDNVDETSRYDHGRGLVERVKDYTVDIAVAPAGLGDDEITEAELYAWQLRVILPRTAALRMRRGAILRPSDLRDWQIVAAPRRHRSRELLERAFAEDNLELRLRVESANQHLLAAIAKTSHALAAVLPDDAFGRPDPTLGPVLAGKEGLLGGRYAIYTRRSDGSGRAHDVQRISEAIARALMSGTED
jgi:DNA-binding transcriptional LysR family regulator